MGDVELHVLEEGDGPPVLLLHGFPELAYSKLLDVVVEFVLRQPRREIRRLGQAVGNRAIAPDQRGYGRSSRPAERADYDIVGDALGCERAAVVGHDWGSMVAWSLGGRQRRQLVAPRDHAPTVGGAHGRERSRRLLDPATTMRRFLAGLTTAGASPRSASATPGC
ncbi:MAG: alpha/beta fold hydrolase [Acidimicrobiia bacterium]|nr:alpha/beta fold hydrolase [Acidimicrobiia bacterium]